MHEKQAMALVLALAAQNAVWRGSWRWFYKNCVKRRETWRAPRARAARAQRHRHRKQRCGCCCAHKARESAPTSYVLYARIARIAAHGGASSGARAARIFVRHALRLFCVPRQCAKQAARRRDARVVSNSKCAARARRRARRVVTKVTRAAIDAHAQAALRAWRRRCAARARCAYAH